MDPAWNYDPKDRAFVHCSAECRQHAQIRGWRPAESYRNPKPKPIDVSKYFDAQRNDKASVQAEAEKKAANADAILTTAAEHVNFRGGVKSLADHTNDAQVTRY
jgi:hypothetical protein